jgi:hypothetical protein
MGRERLAELRTARVALEACLLKEVDNRVGRWRRPWRSRPRRSRGSKSRGLSTGRGPHRSFDSIVSAAGSGIWIRHLGQASGSGGAAEGNRESIWAYLPVGPLERQIREGSQGGNWRRGSEEPSRKSYLALAGHFGEASANYIDRCNPSGKVARVAQNGKIKGSFLKKAEGKLFALPRSRSCQSRAHLANATRQNSCTRDGSIPFRSRESGSISLSLHPLERSAGLEMRLNDSIQRVCQGNWLSSPSAPWAARLFPQCE